MRLDRAVTFEYSKFWYEIVEDTEEGLEDGKLLLTEKSVKELEKLNKSLNFLEIGRNRIRVLNCAGVVSFGNVRLEILPKFLRKSYRPLQPPESVRERRVILSNLLEMLKHTGMLKVKDVNLTCLGENDDFFEVFVYVFAKNLLNLLKSKVDACYVRRKEELKFVRGRIDVRKYVSSPNLHRIPCEFYERIADTPVNRTLKYVCYLLSRITRSEENYRLLRQIIAILDPVTLTPVSIDFVRGIEFNRLNSEFRPFIRFCESFLSSNSLSLWGGGIEFFSIIFPMEKLFEEFMAAVISRLLKGAKLHIQKSAGYLVTEPRAFRLVPDIVVEKDGEICVIDTKYKLLRPEERRYGISQQDLYRIYAYCKVLKARKAILLYPEEPNGEKIEKNLTLRGDISLFVRTIPLGFDLRKDWSSFLDEVENRLSKHI